MPGGFGPSAFLLIRRAVAMVRTCSFLIALGGALLLAGCAATYPAAMLPVAEAPVEPRPADANPLEQQLRAAAEDWYGTPYRYGGTTRDGIDCSAFVQTIFRDELGLSLPRVTAEQVHEGAPVPRGPYQPGDLIFFRPTNKTRHVGLYLGDGEFVHAGTREGVTLARLDDPYWRRVFWTARRVLPDVAVQAPPPPSAPTPSWSQRKAPRPAVRSGW